SGPCLPKTVLYQAELHSDRRNARNSLAFDKWQAFWNPPRRPIPARCELENHGERLHLRERGRGDR
ncbi:MAG: hypothetical protein OXN84_07180, partial [Albidovulum sp.]|nr:hypothetical protein [Albidovulum sp.]